MDDVRSSVQSVIQELRRIRTHQPKYCCPEDESVYDRLLTRMLVEKLTAAPDLNDYVTLLERNNGRLREVLKEALDQTGCDGDLCNYRWHEKARVLLCEDDVRV
jgi:hypothetical protein